MSLIQITSPGTNLPVTVSEVKEHLRIDIPDDDRLIESYIHVATKQAENFTKRQLMRATWQYIFDDFKHVNQRIELPRPPISTVTSNVSIEIFGDSGSTVTIASTIYTVDVNNRPLPRVYPTSGNEWPTSVSTAPGSVRITYQTGVTDAAEVPVEIKHWIKMQAGQLYEYREPITPDSFRELNWMGFESLLDGYRIITFAT